MSDPEEHPAESFATAKLRADVARQQMRLAKDQLKRARKRFKEARREAKHARKLASVARRAWKKAKRSGKGAVEDTPVIEKVAAVEVAKATGTRRVPRVPRKKPSALPAARRLRASSKAVGRRR